MRLLCSKRTVKELNQTMTALLATYGDIPVVELIQLLGGSKND